MKFEKEIFELISSTGEARNNIFNALSEMAVNNKEKSDEYMKLANDQMLNAHNMQTKIIQQDIEEDGGNVSLLMVHAQDQFMTAMSEEFLVTKMIEMYQYIHKLEAKING